MAGLRREALNDPECKRRAAEAASRQAQGPVIGAVENPIEVGDAGVGRRIVFLGLEDARACLSSHMSRDWYAIGAGLPKTAVRTDVSGL